MMVVVELVVVVVVGGGAKKNFKHFASIFFTQADWKKIYFAKY